MDGVDAAAGGVVGAGRVGGEDDPAAVGGPVGAFAGPQLPGGESAQTGAVGVDDVEGTSVGGLAGGAGPVGEDELFAVGGPGGVGDGAGVRGVVGEEGEPLGVGAVGGDDEEVAVLDLLRVRIGAPPAAGEGDQLAVGGPGGRGLRLVDAVGGAGLAERAELTGVPAVGAGGPDTAGGVGAGAVEGECGAVGGPGGVVVPGAVAGLGELLPGPAVGGDGEDRAGEAVLVEEGPAGDEAVLGRRGGRGGRGRVDGGGAVGDGRFDGGGRAGRLGADLAERDLAGLGAAAGEQDPGEQEARTGVRAGAGRGGGGP